MARGATREAGEGKRIRRRDINFIGRSRHEGTNRDVK
jgi:hypothetical protein